MELMLEMESERRIMVAVVLLCCEEPVVTVMTLVWRLI
jgi:hypothetical protein